MILISLIKVTDAALAKIFQKSIKMNADYFIVFNIYNAIIACIYFFSAGGFKPEANFITVVFSLIYAIFVALNHLLTFLSYSKTSVAFVSVISTSGSIIIPTLFGISFLDEKISLRLIISVLLLLLSVVLPSVSLIKNKSEQNSLPILLGFFFVSGILVIITKLYSVTEGTLSSNTFFLLTNVVILLLSLILFSGKIVSVRQHSSKAELKRLLKLFSFSQIANIGIRNVISDISAV